MTTMTVTRHANLFIPCERWKTEHGDYRNSYWGVGYRDEATALAAIEADRANRPVPAGELLSDAMVQRLAK